MKKTLSILIFWSIVCSVRASVSSDISEAQQPPTKEAPERLLEDGVKMILGLLN